MTPFAALAVFLSAASAPWADEAPPPQADPDPLPAMARRMKEAETRLEAEDTGRGTQKLQEELLAQLDRLIEENAPPPDDDKPCPPGNNEKKDPETKKRASDEGNVKRPAEAEAPHPVVVEAKPWGELTPREREGLIQEMRENYPEEYALDVERYFKQLAETKGP